ncbi:MAG TPA: ABC transporter permease [Geobacterales bacterium]|nr:ABC transporter permease [Geobacterales bacterium]
MSKFFSRNKPLIKEFFSRSFGIIGVALLIFYIAMSIAAPIDAPNVLSNWISIDAWQDNPRAVPPVWYMQLINAPYFPTITLESTNHEDSNLTGLYQSVITITLSNTYQGLPTGFVFYITYEYSSQVLTTLTVVRPDNNNITLNVGNAISFPVTNKTISYTTRLTSDTPQLKEDIYKWLSSHKINLTGFPSSANIIIGHMLFSKLNQNILYRENAEPLQGIYKFVLYAFSFAPVSITDFKIIIDGNAYGIMGTDGNKRDVWAGLLWGAPIALMIGTLTSLFSLIIGLVYGVYSGYFGGRLDEILMRIVDVLISIPVLPLLILFLVYFGRASSIWIIIFLISIFGWMGIARVARSSALQIKGYPFIEASKVAGASNTWIIFRHIIPQLLPYAYASLALGVPAAILTEASLSFLGLGDPNLPTWGQILNHAQDISAVQFGYWWLWIPPGLLIAGISLAFVFIGHALDEVLNPRIRRL